MSSGRGRGPVVGCMPPGRSGSWLRGRCCGGVVLRSSTRRHWSPYVPMVTFRVVAGHAGSPARVRWPCRVRGVDRETRLRRGGHRHRAHSSAGHRVPQLVTGVLPAGVTVLELRDEQAPYRRVVAITDARQQSSELTRMFIRFARQAATRSPIKLNADNVHYVKLA